MGLTQAHTCATTFLSEATGRWWLGRGGSSDSRVLRMLAENCVLEEKSMLAFLRVIDQTTVQ